MRHPAKSLSRWAAILVLACLAAGCGSTASSVISNLPTISRTATASSGSGTTAPATTEPPATTAPPATTEPPATTAVPATTAAPATSSAVPSPAVSVSPGAGSGTSLLWLWILLAVAVLAGLIALITHSARRRSADAAGRQSRLIDAYAKGSALHDAMSVAEAPGVLTAGDAGARWADIQRRADELVQTLYSLRETAADPADQARITDVLVSLQAVRSAMDAERAPGGASPGQAEVVRGRLLAFEQALRALRGSGQEFT